MSMAKPVPNFVDVQRHQTWLSTVVSSVSVASGFFRVALCRYVWLLLVTVVVCLARRVCLARPLITAAVMLTAAVTQTYLSVTRTTDTDAYMMPSVSSPDV